MKVSSVIQNLEVTLTSEKSLKQAASQFDVESALKEVQEKTEEQVESETAFKWASRCIACFQLYKKTEKLKWYIQALHYRDEALEHAALVKDDGKVLKTVESEMDKFRVEPKQD